MLAVTLLIDDAVLKDNTDGYGSTGQIDVSIDIQRECCAKVRRGNTEFKASGVWTYLDGNVHNLPFSQIETNIPQA